MKTITIPFDKYLQVVNPTYTIYRVIPNTGVRNFKADKIASVINKCYVNLMDRCKKEDYKYIYSKPAKVAYMMVYEKEQVGFYFIVPDFRKHLIKEKVSGCWKNVTIEEVSELPSFSPNCVRYQLGYTKEDTLSLNTNKVNNELLTSTLHVVDMLEDGDKIGILYNFIPTGGYRQKGFRNSSKEVLQKFKDNKPLEKNKTTKKYIGLTLLRSTLNFIDTMLESLGGFLGGKQIESNITEQFYKLTQQKSLHSSTESKAIGEVIKTQIVVLSHSKDKSKAETNALSVTESYKSISEDNSLTAKKIKNKIDPMSYDLGTCSNLMSASEIGSNCISLPGRTLIEQYPIKSINVHEQKIPFELQNGYLLLGNNTHRGTTVKAYLSDKPNMTNLGLTLLGPQGSGKTTYIRRYVECAIKAGEGVIIPDFIKNCELAQSIIEITPPDKLVRINLADVSDFQGLGFNEVRILEGMTDFQILEIANQQSQQVIALIDAINHMGDPLSPHMRRYLSAACMIAYIHPSQSLKTVVRILENYKERTKYIGLIPANLAPQLEDEVVTLEELNETHKDGTQGTRSSKIENILARVNLLREDIRLKYMFNKGTENNIDFVEAMDQGKVIIIEMPEYKYQTKFIKNILVTYFISKIWVACQMRGYLHKDPPRVHCIVDEIFQAPTAEVILKDILVQARKFQLKFVFSCHYLSQIKITEALKSSGSSYMLMRGSDKKNFNELKSEMYPYEEDDLLNLKEYHSMNLINTTSGYSSFITDLYDSKYDNKKKEPN